MAIERERAAMRTILALLAVLARIFAVAPAWADPVHLTSVTSLPIMFDCDPATVKPKLESVRTPGLGMSTDEAFLWGGQAPACISVTDLPSGPFTRLAVITQNCEQSFCGGFVRLRGRDGEWRKGSSPFQIAKAGAALVFYASRELPDLVEDSPPGLGGGSLRMAWSANEQLYLPTASEEAAASLARRSTEAMTFRAIPSLDECQNCSWVAGEGEIIGTTDAEFRRFSYSNRLRPGSRLLLHSPGGDVLAAMRMGRDVRENGFATEVARLGEEGGKARLVKGECLSACTFVFIGGVRRDVPLDSLLGFHGVRAADGLDARMFDPEYATAMLYDYVLDNDVHGDVILFAMQVPSSRICLFDPDQLERWNVVTAGTLPRLPRRTSNSLVRFEEDLTKLEAGLRHPHRHAKLTRTHVRVKCAE